MARIVSRELEVLCCSKRDRWNGTRNSLDGDHGRKMYNYRTMMGKGNRQEMIP